MQGGRHDERKTYMQDEATIDWHYVPQNRRKVRYVVAAQVTFFCFYTCGDKEVRSARWHAPYVPPEKPKLRTSLSSGCASICFVISITTHKTRSYSPCCCSINHMQFYCLLLQWYPIFEFNLMASSCGFLVWY